MQHISPLSLLVTLLTIPTLSFQLLMPTPGLQNWIIDRLAQNNNVRLNRAKSAEIIFTNCKRKDALPPRIPDIHRVTFIKMLGVTSSL